MSETGNAGEGYRRENGNREKQIQSNLSSVVTQRIRNQRQYKTALLNR
jgi:hypothetical protein